MNYLEACGILGASPNDDLKTIKNHYKSKIRFYHPDNYQDNKEKIEYAEEMTKKLNEAWEYIQQNYDNPTKMDSDTSYNDQPTEEIVVHTYVSIEFKIFLIALAVIAIAAIFFCITEGVNLWLDEKREEREYSQYIDSLSEDDRMAFETYNFTTVEGGYSISAINTSISGSVTIPEEFDGIPIVAIGDGAFRDCIELAEVIMPNSILYVGAESFEGCTSLSNVKFSDSLKEISNYAFHDCSALQAVQLPNCIEKIGSKAFKGCQSLSNINIPTSLTKITSTVFSGCSSLKIVDIPSTIKEVDYCAFENCVGIEEIVIAPNVKISNTTWPVFTGAKSVKKATVPAHWLKTLSEIDIEEIIITDTSNGVNIPVNVSASCIKLENGIKTIDDYEFYYLDLLKKIYLPASIEKIEDHAISSCPLLTDIYYDGTIEEWNAINIDEEWKGSKKVLTIHCTDGTTEQ